jgi:hypothetical protein
MNVTVAVFGYENLPPDLGRPQSLINAAIERYQPDWFVFIFWHQLGRDAGFGMTGTEEEWDLARRASEQGQGRPWLSAYFNEATPHPYDVDEGQRESLRRFQGHIFGEREALACRFVGTAEFVEKFRAHLTERLLTIAEQDREPSDYSLGRIKEELAIASRGLLRWPRTVGQDQAIDRPELYELRARILDTDSSTTLLLGAPGSGKSALLATLGTELQARGIPTLAIKADMLGRSVTTPEDLREWSQCSVAPRDALRVLAQQGPVVLLVDQLDALSELLDRQSDRLNVLLNLIQGLSGTSNLHIVASCREFEFRHDVRLSSLQAERIELQLPPWQHVVPILEQAGHAPATMGDPLRELLRTPLHLKVFLDLASPGAVFASLHALLGGLWEERVVDPHGPHERLALLESLAARMAEEENLWVSAALADEHPEARQRLEQAEILARGPDGQTIGFRHQSYYEYTRARQFGRGAASLAEHVLERQDGLFVRPALLAGLAYLRSTARRQYQRELQALMDAQPRLHIRTLIVEYLGWHGDPDDLETAVVLPLLDSEVEGPRALAGVRNSPGWFRRLRHDRRLAQWMRRPPEQAIHCVPLLSGATRFDSASVLALLEEHWLPHPAYDALTLTVLLDLQRWDLPSVTIAAKVVRRCEWWGAAALAERAAESAPELAAAILRADLDRRLERVLHESPSSDGHDAAADSGPRCSSERLHRLLGQDQHWTDMETVAEAAPAAFLNSIWVWFLDVMTRIAAEEHPFVRGYRDDPVTCRCFDGELAPPLIVRSLLAAILALAESEPSRYLQFVGANAASDLMIVHRLLSRGLESVAAGAPAEVLEYLLADQRRLVLGEIRDRHRESKRLITALCPHLSVENRLRLEGAILAFDGYRRVPAEWTPNERFERLRWVRQDRLRLLRAFSDHCLSFRGRRLRQEEERALPDTPDEQMRFVSGTVGPRMTVAEMRRASDEDLLRLFDELPDGTEWDHPRRRWSEDLSRAGGAMQLSREFRELAKSAPERGAALLSRLEPGRHETYAGAALEGLAESDFPTTRILELVEESEQRGFRSSRFRDDAASAIEKLASRAHGLPRPILDRLEGWLAEHPEPAWPSHRTDNRGDETEYGRAILFGHGGIFPLPSGRGAILRALAVGLLAKNPPDLDGWARVIESRLGRECHPTVWVLTLSRMPVLFTGDCGRATGLYDAVIRACPAVLRHQFALYAIAQVIGQCQPRELVQNWLEILIREGSPFCRQAYAELLMLYHCQHGDAWSAERIGALLGDGTEPASLCGLAHAASHLWHWGSCQGMVTEVLIALATRPDTSIQGAVARVFAVNRDNLPLNAAMRRLIDTVITRPPVLLKAAEDLVEAVLPFVGTEPNLVARVCEGVLSAVGPQVSYTAGPIPFLAGTITDIALTLHRQAAHRERGLRLFERLLEMNVREAHGALDLLDRRPVQMAQQTIRRRRRRRHIAW